MRNTGPIVFILIFIYSFLISNCQDKTNNPLPMNGTQIRIENKSDQDFHHVLAVFPKDSVFYGKIPKGTSSEYENVTCAYRYAYIELFAKNKKYVIQPIDYFGEQQLDEGFFTYALNIVGEDRYDLTLIFIKDP